MSDAKWLNNSITLERALKSALKRNERSWQEGIEEERKLVADYTYWSEG